MTPERLAKVAEVLWVAQAVYGGATREWAEMAWADMGGSEPSEERAEHEIVVSAVAPLLDEFQVEDEARGAARVREAMEAVIAEAERRSAGNIFGPVDWVTVPSLRAALDAAEKAAVEGANAPLTAESDESGSLDVRDAAGLSGAHRGSVDWSRINHGKCPACGDVKFIGHGPLCWECYMNGAGE